VPALSSTVHGEYKAARRQARRQTRLQRAEIIDTLAAHFRRRYGLTPDTVTGGEMRAAQHLARAKFASSEWTARLP
jgi:lipoate-protein ligase A